MRELEARYGAAVDRLDREQQRQLLSSTPFFVRALTRFGPQAPTVRLQLLLAFAQRQRTETAP